MQCKESGFTKYSWVFSVASCSAEAERLDSLLRELTDKTWLSEVLNSSPYLLASGKKLQRNFTTLSTCKCEASITQICSVKWQNIASDQLCRTSPVNCSGILWTHCKIKCDRKQLRRNLKKPLHYLIWLCKNEAKFNSDNSAIFVTNAFCYYRNQYKNDKDQQGEHEEKMLDGKKNGFKQVFL